MNFRNSHIATLLQDGRVLIVGGTSLNTAEVYDPTTQTFSATGSTTVPRFSGITATLLADGRVLIAGGADRQSPSVRNSAELYDPQTGTFTATGSMTLARQFHTAARLPDGSVLVSGGRHLTTAPRPLSSHERYLPGSGTFVPAGGMFTQRSSHTATVLANGRVVLIGGSSTTPLVGVSAETYDPAVALALTGVPLPDAGINSAYPGVVLGATGGSGAPYTVVLESGSLPPGLTYNPSTFALGVNQTPTAVGVYTVGMRLTDSSGNTGVEPLTIRVSPLDITTQVLPNPTFGTAYRFTLGASGVGPVSWSVFIGSLPAGLSLVGNTITGTPTGTIGSSFTLRVVDAAGQVAKQNFFLSVLTPPADQQSSWDTNQPVLALGGT